MHLPTVFPERCAAEWGQDEHGIFMGFAVGRFVQRMRWIPPGKFLMGSPENEVGRFDDETQHPVELIQGYWLADTPVTQALWEAVMGSNPSHFIDIKEPTRPVEQVSWDDCQEFLQRLNERVAGLNARLPTEAEWEYACRAGTKTATWLGDLEKGQKLTGLLLDPIAWYHHNAEGTTHPVARKQPNPWGLYDMLGNVHEWCADRYEAYDAYKVMKMRDPSGPAMGVPRVFRGGSWFAHASSVRAAYRFAFAPVNRRDFLGLRLARGPAPSVGSGAPRRADSPPPRTVA